MRVSKNPLHPDLLRLEADVFNQAALDVALTAHPNRGFICTVDERDMSAVALLASRGFTPVRRTVEGGWQGDPSMPLPEFKHGTLAQRPDLTQPWLAAHKHHYAASHRANPAAVLDTKSWDEIFLGEDFQPESAFYILAGETIAAFSSLRPSSEGWELAWFGTTSAFLSDFAALNAGLVALETKFMAKQGIPSALAEWDSTSVDAIWRTHQYTLEKPCAYLTFTRVS